MNQFVKENIKGIEYDLNPKLYDDKELKSDVLAALQRIANTFIEDLQENNIPLNVVDIWLVGSNATYNYTDKSDIDLHVIVNTDGIECGEILGLLYNYAKADFNKKHDIKVKGLPVELYIEPVGSTAVTNGIYSIQDNRWVKYPHESPVIEIGDITDTSDYKEIKAGVDDVLSGDSIENIQNVIDDLYLIRQISLSTDGEFGLGNLIFKQIRNEGLLDALKDKKRELVDKELTLEKLQEKKNKQLQITSGDPAEDLAFFNANMSVGGCGLGESVEFDGDEFGEKIAEDVEGNIIYKQEDEEHPYSIYYYRHNTVTQPLVSMLADTLVDLLDAEELRQMYADMEKDEDLLPEDWAKNNMDKLLKSHTYEICEIFEPYIDTL